MCRQKCFSPDIDQMSSFINQVAQNVFNAAMNTNRGNNNNVGDYRNMV